MPDQSTQTNVDLNIFECHQSFDSHYLSQNFTGPFEQYSKKPKWERPIRVFRPPIINQSTQTKKFEYHPCTARYFLKFLEKGLPIQVVFG